MAIEFASLPGEFATVGKLGFIRKPVSHVELCSEKNEFASLPRFLSRGAACVVRPPTDLATYGGVEKSCRILAATFGILLTVSAFYASTAPRWPRDHLGIRLP